MASRYTDVYEAWRRDPEGFWREAAGAISVRLGGTAA